MTDQRTTDFSTLPPIMAVDFDGTLVVDKFPEIGEEKTYMCRFVRNAQTLGIRTILWTSRTGKALLEAVEWCEKKGLHFDAVNTNIQEVIDLTGTDTRKVFANVYLDDRNKMVGESGIKSCVKELMAWLGK